MNLVLWYATNVRKVDPPHSHQPPPLPNSPFAERMFVRYFLVLYAAYPFCKGTWRNNSDAPCAECTIGTFSSDGGSTACVTCTKGSYAGTNKASVCSLCTPGRAAEID